MTHLEKLLLFAALIVALSACDPPPISQTAATFDRGQVGGVNLDQPTSIAFGPDGRLYVAELEGGIVAIALDESGTAAESVETIAESSDFNQILGMAFDSTRIDDPSLYISHNFVNGTASTPFANEIVRLSGVDFVNRDTVISGLPVSGHNHGTNGLAFTPQGELLIAQGGTTSSGTPSDADDQRWRDWDETPLSGAILVANVHDPNFDGRITYDSPNASSTTNQLTGDVSVFSPGHRNTYGLLIHRTGSIFSLDNGSSEPVPSSIDCQTLGPPPENDPDQLNLVVEGAYYGHPNRNRARFDDRQCSYQPPYDETPAENMLLLVPPSSNAIIEFRGDHFGGTWDGDLIYAWWTGGEVRRLILSPEGTSVEGEELIASDLALPLAMAQSYESGTVYIAEFGSGTVAFLTPK